LIGAPHSTRGRYRQEVAMVVFVDVADTLVRSVGTKRIPMPRVNDRVRSLHRDGHTLFLWSTGGGDYARATASEFGLCECFSGFSETEPHHR
jgi:hypothetical protein